MKHIHFHQNKEVFYMKKFMSLLLVGIMMLSLVACGKSGGGKGELNVGVFYYTYSDTYISSVRTALDNALTEAGIKFQNYDGNSNQTTQNEQIDTAIAQGTNLLIVNIVTSGSVDASQAIVDKASAAGIPVIFFNRAVESDEDEGKVLGSYDKCAFVGTDAPEAGHMQGKMVGQYVVDNFDAIDLNGDGKISYAMFMGQLGNVEAIYRTQYGVEDADAVITAAGKPALEYFDASNTDKYQVDQDGNWSATAANNYMTTNLSQYNESAGNMIELVICNNDGMAAMGKNLNDLKMDGSRTTQILGALASNVETLEQQQVLANQAFADGTSIINEFNTKNNTAQAQYEKSLKIVQNIRVEIGQFFQPAIQNLTNMLASLAQSSAKNLQDEYEKVKVTKGEIENKTRAVESLGQAYNDLKSKTSLNSTEQDTLNQTIQKLARICPSAVTAYNNLGEALDVNIDKLKEAIQHQEKLNQLQGQKLASEAYDNLESDWKSLQKSIKNSRFFIPPPAKSNEGRRCRQNRRS